MKFLWNGEAPELNEILRDNLSKLNLGDIMVEGIVVVDNFYTHKLVLVDIGPMHLSQVCGAVRPTINIQRGDEVSKIFVIHNDANIGFVDSSHRFHYEAAPDLRVRRFFPFNFKEREFVAPYYTKAL